MFSRSSPEQKKKKHLFHSYPPPAAPTRRLTSSTISIPPHRCWRLQHAACNSCAPTRRLSLFPKYRNAAFHLQSPWFPERLLATSPPSSPPPTWLGRGDLNYTCDLDRPCYSYLGAFSPPTPMVIKDVLACHTYASSHLNSRYCHVGFFFFVSSKLVFDGEPCPRTEVIMPTFKRGACSHTDHVMLRGTDSRCQ